MFGRVSAANAESAMFSCARPQNQNLRVLRCFIGQHNYFFAEYEDREILLANGWGLQWPELVLVKLHHAATKPVHEGQIGDSSAGGGPGNRMPVPGIECRRIASAWRRGAQIRATDEPDWDYLCSGNRKATALIQIQASGLSHRFDS